MKSLWDEPYRHFAEKLDHLHGNGKYEEAIELYEFLLKTIPEQDVRFLESMVYKMECCRLAKKYDRAHSLSDRIDLLLESNFNYMWFLVKKLFEAELLCDCGNLQESKNLFSYILSKIDDKGKVWWVTLEAKLGEVKTLFYLDQIEDAIVAHRELATLLSNASDHRRVFAVQVDFEYLETELGQKRI